MLLRTAKKPFNLPSEYETGFTVKMNPDSIIKYPLRLGLQLLDSSYVTMNAINKIPSP